MPFNIQLFESDLFKSKVTYFDEMAVALFNWQVAHNGVLREYYLNVANNKPIERKEELVFLPVEFFKTRLVCTGDYLPEAIFTSSSTSGSVPSKHHVKSLGLYVNSFTHGFSQFYGEVNDYVMLALLPSYLEREGSSLVYMADHLIRTSGWKESGFYLNDFEQLSVTLQYLKSIKQKTILLGVTFALLDFVESHPISFPELIVMETGGMKGRRMEMIRPELHALLKKGFGITSIHSEYGMTELLSQAYSKGEGKYFCPPWMQVIITNPTDPFEVFPIGKTGIINVIDLANMHSCAFVQTSDLGIKNDDGSFDVLGRLDSSDIRGCSLLYA